jgi:hypothetical protein
MGLLNGKGVAVKFVTNKTTSNEATLVAPVTSINLASCVSCNQIKTLTSRIVIHILTLI